MITVGIDPGKTGAVSIYAHNMWSVSDCPTCAVERKSSAKAGKSVRNVPDAALMSELLRPLVFEDEVHVYIERVGVMPREGAVGAFSFGRGYGIWLGILAALRLPHTLVTPQSWKKAMVGTGKSKDESRQRALALFPYLAKDLGLKKHDGRADALLIGEYGRVHKG